MYVSVQVEDWSRQFNEWNFADTSLVCANACVAERMAHEKRKPSDANRRVRWVANELIQTNGMNERTKCEHERNDENIWNEIKANKEALIIVTLIFAYLAQTLLSTAARWNFLSKQQLSSNSTCNNNTTTMREDSVMMLVSISKRWQLPLAFCMLLPLLLLFLGRVKYAQKKISKAIIKLSARQSAREKSSQFFSVWLFWLLFAAIDGTRHIFLCHR